MSLSPPPILDSTKLGPLAEPFVLVLARPQPSGASLPWHHQRPRSPDWAGNNGGLDAICTDYQSQIVRVCVSVCVSNVMASGADGDCHGPDAGAGTMAALWRRAFVAHLDLAWCLKSWPRPVSCASVAIIDWHCSDS